MIDFLKQFDGSGRKPRDVQSTGLKWLADGYHTSEVDAINGPVGCHAKGQGILMADGTIKRVEDVQVGDLVQGVEGARLVLRLVRGRQTMARIVPVKGTPFTVNLDHILALKVSGGRNAVPKHLWHPSSVYISVKEFLELPAYAQANLKLFRVGVEYEGSAPTIPPYILGLWLGDGSTGFPAITKYPSPMVDAWCEYGATLGLRVRRETKPGSAASTWYLVRNTPGTNAITAKLRGLGVCDDKHIPLHYLSATRSARLELLAGLADSDGHGRDGGLDFVFKSEKLARGVAHLCWSLGLAAYLQPCKKTCTNTGAVGDYWRISVSGDLSIIPTRKIPFPARKQKKSVLVTGFSVELLDEADFYGFTVDGDNLYLLDDFTVTHNCGKSAISRAVQKVTGAFVIIPSNILMDQCTETYRTVNFLKGKNHYKCVQGLTCGEWQDVLDQKPCHECPYKESKDRAKQGEPTFFNPMSFYYLMRHAHDLKPSCIIVDEAHQLPQMVLQLCSKKFRQKEYNFPKEVVNELFLINWMRTQIDKLTKLALLYKGTNNHKKCSEIATEIETISMTLQGLEENPQNYAIWIEKGTYRNRPDQFLNVKAIRPPRFVMRQLLNAKKLILMSGTLVKTDLEDLASGRPYRYLDLPSPIPKENRPILYRPTPYPMNVNTDPVQIVRSIEAILDEFPNRNTIIHTTYERAKKFAPLFKRPVLFNTPENKTEVLERFKRFGGVFLASGCAEGLDLRDDLCRLNIIPHLVRPNLGDPVVAKRRALVDGDRWLALEAMKTCIQQYGRSTRHEKDHSITVVMDPTFAQTITQYKNDIPRYFLEGIRWAR